MPTIHIHIDDPSTVADIVAGLMAYDLTITVTSEPSGLAARAATETGRIHPVITSIEAERAFQASLRASFDAERHAVAERDYDHNLSVVCPHCAVQPTQPCVRPRGDYYPRPFVHARRRFAANNAELDRIDAAIDAVDRHHDGATYCMCGHTDAVHDERGDRPCDIDACSCPSYTAVMPFAPVTLDEM